MKLSDAIELTFLESSLSKHQRHQPPLEPIKKKKKKLFSVSIHPKKINDQNILLSRSRHEPMKKNRLRDLSRFNLFIYFIFILYFPKSIRLTY